MIKKLITPILIIILLLLTIYSCCFLSDCLYSEKIEAFSPEETLGIKPPVFVFYNGTRFFINDVTPIFLENREPLFYLTMQLIIPEYNSSISVSMPDSDAKYVYKPLYSDEKNGSYNINSLPINPTIKKGEYPYDYYIGNISFWDKNSDYANLFTYGVNKTYSSPEWKMVIFGDYNKLHFTLYRVKDISIFEILCIIGIFVLLVNIWLLILLLVAYLNRSIKSPLLFVSNILFYIGVSVGIPFYFGVIFNNYLLTNPIQNSSHILNLYILVLLAVIIGAFGFAIKEKIRG